MGANKLGGDGEAEAASAGARRALERLEQVLTRFFGEAGPRIRYLDHDDGALAPSGNTDLITAGIARIAALQRLQGIARQIEQDAEQLIVVGLDDELPLDRAD